MPDEIVFDGRDFEDLGRQLRHAAERYEREMTPTMGEIGKMLAETAKGIASIKSSRVAETIHASTLPNTAVIRAGDEATPIAVLWELGNRGSKRTADTFRRPVYGRWDVNPGPSGKDPRVQEKFPYLTAARTLRRAEVLRMLERAWERVLRMIETEGRP